LLCKEENVRAGRIPAAGKMKETVVVTVHKGAMKTMDNSKITDDRVGSRQIMYTAKKMVEEGCKVDNREVMVSKDMDKVVITAVSKAATGASRDTAERKVVSVDMDRKGNMVSRAGIADSKVGTVDMSMKDNMANKDVMEECRVDMASSMKTNTKIRGMMKIMMKMTTAPACRDAMVVKKRKTMTTIGILRKMKMMMKTKTPDA